MKNYRTSNSKQEYYFECDRDCGTFVHMNDLFGVGEFAYCMTHAKEIILRFMKQFEEQHGIKLENENEI